MSHAQQQSGYDITRRDKTSVRQFSKLQRRPSEEKPGGEKKTVICLNPTHFQHGASAVQLRQLDLFVWFCLCSLLDTSSRPVQLCRKTTHADVTLQVVVASDALLVGFRAD